MTRKSSRRPAPGRTEQKPPTLVISWTEWALSDLEAIGAFIAIANPIAADRWVARLIRAAETAAAMPLAGRRVPELDPD